MAFKCEEMRIMAGMMNIIQVEVCLTNEMRNHITAKFEKEELPHQYQLAMFSICSVG
jgi:hypothetical protein